MNLLGRGDKGKRSIPRRNETWETRNKKSDAVTPNLFSVKTRYKILALSLSQPGGQFYYIPGRHINENCALALRALFLFWADFSASPPLSCELCLLFGA